MTSHRTTRYILLGFLLMTGFLRWQLVDRGHFFWSDERCYLPALAMAEELASGAWTQAFHRPFEAVGRPGFVVVSLIPASLQHLAAAWGGAQAGSLASYDLVSCWNVLITLGLIYCLYRISLHWFDNHWLAVTTAIVYGSLLHSFVWIRHAVPYYESLLFMLIALTWLSAPAGHLSRSAFYIRLVFAGCITAFGFSCYPGHYGLVLINGAAALAAIWRFHHVADACTPAISHSRWRMMLTACFCFGAGGLSIPIIFEAIAQLAGASYFGEMRKLSGTITMGDFGEAYVYAFRYLRDVEGLIGVALFVSFLVSLPWLLLTRDGRTRSTLVARATIAAAVIAYLLHAARAYHQHAMVFYGRILMAYLPFVVLGGSWLLWRVVHMASLRMPLVPAWREPTTSMLFGGLALVSFVWHYAAYRQHAYPTDLLFAAMQADPRRCDIPANVLWGFVDGTEEGTMEALQPGFLNVTDTRPDGTYAYVITASFASIEDIQPRWIGRNLVFPGYVADKWTTFTPPPGYRVMEEGIYPGWHPALSYEACKPWERKRLLARKYPMVIYQREHEPTLTYLSE